jgi:flagellar motor switch protein FliN/FliY
MAPKKAKIAEPEFEIGDNTAELDQAIDDLRGVLKADGDGTNSFETDFPDVGGTTSSFDTDFGAEEANADTDFGGGDFGGDTFGTSEFGNSDFGSENFGDAPAEMTSVGGSAMHANMDLIMNIPIDVQIILGSSRMQVSSLMNLTEGAIISLDRKIGEPVDLIVNGRLIGRGEITVMESDETRFGIKLIEVKSVSKPQ